MSTVRHIGIDETSVRRGQDYITVVHDLQAKRLLFATPGAATRRWRRSRTQDLQRTGQAAQVEHVCMDMSAAYLKGSGSPCPGRPSSYDRYHVAAMAGQAWMAIDRACVESAKLRQVLDLGKTRRSLLGVQLECASRPCMRCSAPDSRRFRQLKEALRQVYRLRPRATTRRWRVTASSAGCPGPRARGWSRSRSWHEP